MKRLFNLILAAVAATCCAWAQDYGITVGETHVTAENAENVVCENVISGKISYNAKKRELVLENVVCDAEIDCSGHSDNLTIRLVGENICGGWLMAAFNQRTTITGNGTGVLNAGGVSMQGMTGYGILHLKGCTLRCNLSRRNQFGISGTNNETLIIEDATIESDGLRESVGMFGSIGLIRSRLMEPSGAMLEGGAVTMFGRPICRKVVIRP